MAVQAVEPSVTPSQRTWSADPAPTRNRIVPLLVWLAVSWTLPWLLLGAHLGRALAVVLLLATASVLRVGGVLLDRLVAAGLVLSGAVLVLGLLMSVWPWGLDPGPSCAVLLSAIGGWAAATGRKPALPMRFRATDLLVLGTAAVAGWLLLRPLGGLDPVHRLALGAVSADMDEHFAIYDTIQRLGGYLFLAPDAAAPYVHAPTASVYPQGSHFLWAWYDLLTRSGRRETDPVLGYDRYYRDMTASYALMCAAAVWAARWVGGPRLRGWRAGAVCTAVAGLLLSGSFVQLVASGYASEIAGLALTAVAVALLLRPAMPSGDHTLTALAAPIAVCFSYNLYAPVVLAALAAGALAHRTPSRWYLAVVPGALLALVPSVLSAAAFDIRQQANIGGPAVELPALALTGGLLLVVLLAVLAPGGRRRTGPGRAVGLLLLGLLACTAAFGSWQRHTAHYLGYYFVKSVTCDLIVLLVLLGAAGWLLPPARRWGRTLSVVAAAAVLCFTSCLRWDLPSLTYDPWALGRNPLLAWSEGLGTSTAAAQLATFADRDMRRSSGPVIALYSGEGGLNWRTTFFANTLLGQQGVQQYLSSDKLYHLDLGGPPLNRSQYPSSLRLLKGLLRSVPVRPTLLVGDERTADRLRHDLRAALPHRPVDILFAPVLSTPQVAQAAPAP